MERKAHIAAAIEWVKAIQAEEDFWKRWFETKGLQWHDDYTYRTSPTLPCILDPYIDATTTEAPIRILDVGAGPISLVGATSSKAKIVLVACDPLAPLYNKILNDYNVVPYIRTEFAYAEALTDRYNENSFDIVHMCNALDHTASPQIVLYNMMQVTKLLGKIILQHYENEAEAEDYIGFHKWNITEQDGEAIIWGKEEHISINKLLGDSADVHVKSIPESRNRIIVEIQKKSAIPRNVNIYKNCFDEALLDYIYQLTTAQNQ